MSATQFTSTLSSDPFRAVFVLFVLRKYYTLDMVDVNCADLLRRDEEKDGAYRTLWICPLVDRYVPHVYYTYKLKTPTKCRCEV